MTRFFTITFRLRHKLSVYSSTDGSAYFETGLNKVLAIVTGPVESRKQSEQTGKKGVISVHVTSSAFNGNDHRRKRLNERRTLEMESILRKTFEGVVLLELYPRSEINITLHVLETDGSVICTMVNAVTLALMDAGISMSDIITACTVGHVHGNLCVDTNQVEQYDGGEYLPVAVRSKNADLIFLQLNCKLHADVLGEALEVAIMGCRKIKLYLEDVMKSYMSSTLRVLGTS